jgi:pyruvate dehydrogenase E2 component (dihydrolipoamide acetyltransferase)
VYEVAVRMPKMSMTMTQGDIVQWNAQPGDQVSAGEAICEVMTDKVDMDVESPVSGTLLRIEIEEGTVDVGTPIAWISSDQPDPMAGLFDDDAPSTPEEATPQPEGTLPTPDEAVAPAPRPDDGPVPAVPRARGLAREHDLDLAAVRGTGPGGRVLVEDVEAVLHGAGPSSPNPAEAAPSVPTTRQTPPQRVRSRAAQASQGEPAGTARSRSVRAAVARAMTASAAVPQFTVWRDLELEAVDAARAGISWTTLLLRGYAIALREVPALMGRWDGQAAQTLPDLAIGVAVDTPDGLLVPVFAEPDRVPLEQLDADVRATSAAARGGKIDAAHLLPAVATLSNLGSLGVDRFQALVTPPQASVIAAGGVSRRPVAVPGGLGLGLRVTVGLSVDHRVADGADGARLLESLSRAFTQPLRLLGPGGRR